MKKFKFALIMVFLACQLILVYPLKAQNDEFSEAIHLIGFLRSSKTIEQFDISNNQINELKKLEKALVNSLGDVIATRGESGDFDRDKAEKFSNSVLDELRAILGDEKLEGVRQSLRFSSIPKGSLDAGLIMQKSRLDLTEDQLKKIRTNVGKAKEKIAAASKAHETEMRRLFNRGMEEYFKTLDKGQKERFIEVFGDEVLIIRKKK